MEKRSRRETELYGVFVMFRPHHPPMVACRSLATPTRHRVPPIRAVLTHPSSATQLTDLADVEWLVAKMPKKYQLNCSAHECMHENEDCMDDKGM